MANGLTKSKLFQVSLCVANLSQEDIAARLGVSQQAISGVIYGNVQSKRIERYVSMFMRNQLKKLRVNLDIIQENRNAARAQL